MERWAHNNGIYKWRTADVSDADAGLVEEGSSSLLGREQLLSDWIVHHTHHRLRTAPRTANHSYRNTNYNTLNTNYYDNYNICTANDNSRNNHQASRLINSIIRKQNQHL